MDDDVREAVPPGPDDGGRDPAEPAGGGGLRVGTRRQDGCVLVSTGQWVRIEPERG